jgi:hypothetical protein
MRTFPFICCLAGGLIITAYAQPINPEMDPHRVQKYSRQELCKARHLEPCRFRNPMNNDCGHNAVEYTWCIKGDKLK